MQNEFSWCCSSPEVGWRGFVHCARPDPEVVAKPKRRTYTAEYKQRILAEAKAAAATRGGLGAAPPRRSVPSLLTGSRPWLRRTRTYGTE
jgi:hypothetical protein